MCQGCNLTARSTYLADDDADVEDRPEEGVLLADEVIVRLDPHDGGRREGSLVDYIAFRSDTKESMRLTRLEEI